MRSSIKLGVLALLAGGAVMTAPTHAAAVSNPAGIIAAIEDIAVVDNVQLFVYGGRRHCWYVDGWRGPGWYWCGYSWRRGLGWGGPAGWRGWSHPGGRVIVRPGGGGRTVVRPGRGGRVVVRPGGMGGRVVVRPGGGMGGNMGGGGMGGGGMGGGGMGGGGMGGGGMGGGGMGR